MSHFYARFRMLREIPHGLISECLAVRLSLLSSKRCQVAAHAVLVNTNVGFIMVNGCPLKSGHFTNYADADPETKESIRKVSGVAFMSNNIERLLSFPNIFCRYYCVWSQINPSSKTNTPTRYRLRTRGTFVYNGLRDLNKEHRCCLQLQLLLKYEQQCV